MLSRKFVLPILVVFALSFVFAGGVPRAHAQTGPELIVLPATQSNLPAGSTITYQINFANMPAFNGIDISVQTPTTGVISATTIVFSGSVWGFLLTNCVNGVGTGCGATDAPGIAHFSALDTSSFLVGSGNVFNVTYSVQTATGSTGVNIVFDTVSDTAGNPITHTDVNAVYGGPSGDFGISASSPAAVDVTQSAVSTVSLTSIGGFASAVSLSDTPLPSGLTCGALSSSSVTPPGSATLSCSATVAGSYTVTVTGTSGSLTHSATAVFNFVDFTVSASSPAAVDVTQNAVSTITVGALNGFAGIVTLSDTPPAGLTCTVITPATVTGSGTATVSCTATTPGTFTLPVSGTDGVLTRSASVTFNFVGFTISATNPTAVDATQSAVSTITVASQNGFAGVVTLSDTPPAGLTCGAITPGTVTGAGTATVSCTSTVQGTFTLPISGTDGVLTRSTSATFTFRDFTVSASSPAALDVTQNAVSTITVGALNGFSGTVTLSDTPPAGLTCGAITPATVTGSGTATVSCSSATQGTFTLPVSGTDGVLTRTASATFTFRDFTVAASSPSGAAGTSIVSTITVTGLNGFASTVTLSDVVPSGLTCGAITPGTITGSGTATVSCSSPTQATFNLPISGTDGILTRSATAVFTFGPAVNFQLTATTPGAVDVTQSASTTITVSPQNGFTGTVSLSDAPLPTGLSCGAISPASITTSGAATLSCTSTTAGNYVVTIAGTSTTPAIMHTATVTFAFRDFTIAVTSPSGPAGTSLTSTITVTALNGFVATVTLSDVVPSGLTCGAITPGSVPGAGTATVACSSPVAGTFSLPISGTDSILTRSATATFTVGPAVNFGLSASAPAAVDVTQSGSTTITVTAQNGFTGTVSLTDTPLPSGLSCGAINPASITTSGTATLSCSATTAGNYLVTITGTSVTPSLTHTATANFIFRDFTVSATSPASTNVNTPATSTISVAALNGFANAVTLSDVPPSGLTCGSITPGSVTGSGTATVSCTSPTAGTFTLPISGTDGVLTRTAAATFIFTNPVDFTISATSPAAVNVGQSSSSTITVAPVNGFTGTVSLTDTPLPSGLSCGAISPASITTSGTATLSCSATVAGNYVVTITGTSTSPAITKTATTTFSFQDFTVTASPATIDPIAPGSTATSTISVNSLNGFTGTVTLAFNASPGLTATLAPTTFTGSGTATLTVSAATSGTFTVVINGTSPGVPNEAGHIAHVTVLVQSVDFKVTASPDFFIANSQNGRFTFTSTITVTSQGNFSGTVNLSASSTPGGFSLSFSSNSVTVTAGGSRSVTLTGRIGPHANAGTYTITVTGASGSASRTHTITVVIPSKTIKMPALTWTTSLSVSASGGTQTWVATIQNFGNTPQYVQVTIMGLTSGGTHPFMIQSGTVLVAPNSSVDITLSTPSGTFTSSEIGETFTFQVRAFFGSTTSSLNSVSQDQPTGTFTIAA